jgi:hypothetical protein
MSVKIYAGRMIPAPIGRAYAMLMEAKPQAATLGRNLQIAWMAKRAAEMVDRARIDGTMPRGASCSTR